MTVTGGSRAQRGARRGLLALGWLFSGKSQEFPGYFQGINTALPAQGCRHLHSLFSGQYSNSFLRRGHGDVGGTSISAPFPLPPNPGQDPGVPHSPSPARGSPAAPYSLSPGCGGPADQPGLAGADLVDAEGQTPGGHVAALGQRQPPLAHPLTVLPCAAAARAAVLVPLAPGSW